MDLSLFYAKLLSLYLIIASGCLLINAQTIRSYITEESKYTAIVVLTGVISLIFGLIIVISHPLWTGWPLIITLIGVLGIIKGVVRLGFTQWFMKVEPKFVEGKQYYVSTVIAFIVGLVLFYFGFVVS